ATRRRSRRSSSPTRTPTRRRSSGASRSSTRTGTCRSRPSSRRPSSREADHCLGLRELVTDLLLQASDARIESSDSLGEGLHALGDRLHVTANAFGTHLEVALDLVHGLAIHERNVNSNAARGGPRAREVRGATDGRPYQTPPTGPEDSR